jgi:hypothetical protein
MQTEVKVTWPKTVALVFRRLLLPKQVQEDLSRGVDGEEVAYQAAFSKEQILWKKTEISPAEKPQELLAMKYVYKCPVHGAYYLPKVVVRPLDGKTLPKGIIHVYVDGGLLMEGWISDFLPDMEPVNCLKLSGWMKNESTFRAHTLKTNGAPDLEHQIGYMLANDSKVEVRLTDVTTEEPVTLEVGLLSAYYSTKKSEVTV